MHWFYWFLAVIFMLRAASFLYFAGNPAYYVEAARKIGTGAHARTAVVSVLYVIGLLLVGDVI